MTVLLDIYFISAGLGFVYIVGSSFMGGFGSHGHVGSHGGAGHGGAGHGGGMGHSGAHGSGGSMGHSGAHGVRGGTMGHSGTHGSGGGNMGHSGTHGSSGGNMGHSGTQGSGGGHAGTHGSGGSHAGTHGTGGNTGHSATHGSSGHTGHSGTQSGSASHSGDAAQEIVAIALTKTPSTQSNDRVALMLLDVLNPTKWAFFIFLFGAVGAVSIKILPAIGFLSLAPAVVLGWLLANWFFVLMGNVFTRLQTSTNFSKESLIGAIGELTISIPEGSTGEVVVSTGSSRYTSPAKSIDSSKSINKLTKVIVIDIKDGIFFVEPFQE